ncbi:MAG: chemotaxis response regulator protein-glutamate methylesterase [Alphaproteobacteria bacterium]|nr:MAG: chemotaxis response regulator protein-glutamate methylesterase [Alphaproteobacteria bacterium]
MLVDDSAVIRGLFTRALESDPELQVVASVGDGKMALNALKRQPVDVVVLDIEMPVMDGLTALPLLLQAQPGLIVIMASTLTRRNADVSLRALQAGAKDYIPKPTSTSELTSADTFKRELIEKIKALAGPLRSPRQEQPSLTRRVASDPNDRPAPQEKTPASLRAFKSATVTLRPVSTEVPEVLAIGSSTGGPQALFQVLADFPDRILQPIFITQHMPATFTTILAEHLSRVTKRPCAEGKDGEPVVKGRIYVAPGDYHMIVEGAPGKEKVIRLLKTPPENFCRPAVDPMLRSLIQAYGARKILVTILTGMGQDGLRGAEQVVEQGGMVIAQDEPSSVVWGMPGAVATAGLCSAVLPLPEIGPALQRYATGGRG